MHGMRPYITATPRYSNTLLASSGISLASALVTLILVTQYAYRQAQVAVCQGLLTNSEFIKYFLYNTSSIPIYAIITSSLEIAYGLLLFSFRGMYIRRELASARKMFIVITALSALSVAFSVITCTLLLQVYAISNMACFQYIGLCLLTLALLSCSLAIIFTRLSIVDLEQFTGLRRIRKRV